MAKHIPDPTQLMDGSVATGLLPHPHHHLLCPFILPPFQTLGSPLSSHSSPFLVFALLAYS